MMRAEPFVSSDFASLLPMKPAAPVMRMTPSLMAVVFLLRDVQPAEQLAQIDRLAQDALWIELLDALEQDRVGGSGDDANPCVQFTLADVAKHHAPITVRQHQVQ